MDRLLAGYIRVSTEMQTERESLANQEEQIRAFAEQKGRRCQIYRDAGLSARDKDRPAFQKMLSDIESGSVDTVVVTKLDRITRSLKDLIFLKDFFEEHTVDFISIGQNLDTSTPMGRFSFYVLGLVSQLEREVTAERVAEDMRNRARRKKWNGGVVPYGYTTQSRVRREWLRGQADKLIEREGETRSRKEIVKALEQDPEVRSQAEAYARSKIPEPKALLIDPEEADVVREIYRLFLKHKTFRGTTHALNLKATNRQGEKWHNNTVRRILTNSIYHGDLVYNKRKSHGKTSRPRPEEEHIVVEDAVEPIVSKELFSEVQELIRRQARVAPASKGSQYLLSGLVRCGQCGSKMYGFMYDDPRKEGRVYKYYRCNGHTTKGPAFCTGSTIDLDFLEKLIVQELRSFTTHPERLTGKLADHELQFEQEVQPLVEHEKRIGGELQDLDKRLERLLELYEDELITKQEFSERRASIDEKRALWDQELADVRLELSSSKLTQVDVETTLKSIQTLADVYDELEFQERKELLRTVISDITVGKHTVDYTVLALTQPLYIDTERMSVRVLFRSAP